MRMLANGVAVIPMYELFCDTASRSMIALLTAVRSLSFALVFTDAQSDSSSITAIGTLCTPPAAVDRMYFARLFSTEAFFLTTKTVGFPVARLTVVDWAVRRLKSNRAEVRAVVPISELIFPIPIFVSRNFVASSFRYE